MYSKIILASLLSAGLFHAQAQKNVLEAVWRDSTVVIDGNPQDWAQPFRYYDSKSKIQYSVVNDTAAVYICLKTIDDKVQMKILRTGMDVSVDFSGKKKETATVQYPLPSDTKLEWVQEPGDPDQQHLDIPDLKRMKMDYANADKRMKLLGFKNITPDIMQTANKYGIEVAMDWDKNDALTYELKVPYRTFYKESVNAADLEKPFNISVKVGGFDVPQQIVNNSNTDPSISNTGMRNQGYSNQQGQQMGQNMAFTKINDLSLALSLFIRMKLAYK